MDGTAKPVAVVVIHNVAVVEIHNVAVVVMEVVVPVSGIGEVGCVVIDLLMRTLAPRTGFAVEGVVEAH